jgi:hypothetical protein
MTRHGDSIQRRKGASRGGIHGTRTFRDGCYGLPVVLAVMQQINVDLTTDTGVTKNER